MTTSLTELQKIRRTAEVTQIEVAVRAEVSPPLVREFERYGTVESRDKRERLEAVYRELADQAKRFHECR